MDYILGKSLKTTLREHHNGNQISEAQLFDWFTQICQAVQYLHENRMVHGLLWSEKIIVASSGQIKIRPNMSSQDFNQTVSRRSFQALPPEILTNG